MVPVPDLSKENTIPGQPATDRFRVEKLPHHLAIIMDGNGRWAQERNLSRIEGHRAGAESVRIMPCGGC
jgi:undecaprenyl diphosphate synthase